MTPIKTYLSILAISIATLTNAQTRSNTIADDFQNLSGEWKGSLTYLDYTSGKSYTMAADIVVNRIGETNKISFSNIYPDEMNANSTDTLVISADGKYIDKEVVKSRNELPGGEIEIVTEEAGTDGNDNKPAIFRHTYTLGKTTYKKRKDVQFADESGWINRHEYSYTRVAER